MDLSEVLQVPDNNSMSSEYSQIYASNKYLVDRLS